MRYRIKIACKFIASLLLIMMFFYFPNSVFASDTSITSFSVSKEDNQNYFTFGLSNEPKYEISYLQNPSRIVVDLQSCNLNAKIDKALLRNTFVKNIRTGKKEDGSFRLVFDLKKKLKYKSEISQKKNGRYGLTISIPAQIPIVSEKKAVFTTVILTAKPKFISEPSLVDFKGGLGDYKKPSFAAAKKQTDILLSRFEAAVPKPDLPENLRQKLRDIVIVIDPGHGGKDPGVSSANKVREKDVVLAIAKDLRRSLNEEFGIRAILTRSGDYFLPLKERLRIANLNKADLFISIHADTYRKNSSIKGVSIFALSPNNATSESVRWLADKENESELGNKLPNDANALRSVFYGLVQNTTISASLSIAKILLAKLPEVARLHTHRIEQASFVVLKSPNIPSLLIETGFLSDQNEVTYLTNPEYQNKLAMTLAAGVTEYFKDNPPEGTFLSSMSVKSINIVR